MPTRIRQPMNKSSFALVVLTLSSTSAAACQTGPAPFPEPIESARDVIAVGFEEFHAMVGLNDLRQREQDYLDFAKRAVAENNDQIKQ